MGQIGGRQLHAASKCFKLRKKLQRSRCRHRWLLRPVHHGRVRARRIPKPIYATALLPEFFTRRGVGTYIDVGANIGPTTKPVARLPEISIRSIEPGSANFRYLSGANIALNFSVVQLFAAALLDHAGTVDFDFSTLGTTACIILHANGLYHEASLPSPKCARQAAGRSGDRV